MPGKKKFSIKNGNLLYGGTYCLSLEDQAKLLANPRYVKPQNIRNLRKYTDDSICNLYLRGLKLPGDYQEASNVCETIFSLVEKLPPYKLKRGNFIYLYRGITNITFEEAISDKGFMSFTSEMKTAQKFGNMKSCICILRIILCFPYEYKILPLQEISTCDEHEVLLVPGRGMFYPYGKEENTIQKVYNGRGFEELNQTMRTYIYVPITEESTRYTQDALKNKITFDELNLTEEKQL